MATTHEIKVQRREVEGKGASRRLRRDGLIPAIVYGGELKPVNIELNHNEVWLASQNDWFYSSILSLSLNGDIQKVLLRDMQRHPFKQLIMHIDFQRVNDNEALHASVPPRELPRSPTVPLAAEPFAERARGRHRRPLPPRDRA